jgi:sugar lactone lactonase YvrE
MGLQAEKEAGAIWRFYDGRVHSVVPLVTIPNAICFSAAGYACWADTPEQIVWRQPLRDVDGFPGGRALGPRGFPRHRPPPRRRGLRRRGQPLDRLLGRRQGCGLRPRRQEVAEFTVPAKQSTCPAWGGPDFSTLYVTSAAAGLPQAELALNPDSGRTFAVDTGFRGLPEPRVIL